MLKAPPPPRVRGEPLSVKLLMPLESVVEPLRVRLLAIVRR